MQQNDKAYTFNEKRQLLEIGRQSSCDYLFAAKFLLRDMPDEEFIKRLALVIGLIKSEPIILRDYGLLLDYLMIKSKPYEPIKTHRAREAVSELLKQLY